jgi:hypothetical protein
VTKCDNILDCSRMKISSPLVTKSDDTSGGRPSALALDDVFRLSWTHWIALLAIDDPWKRAFKHGDAGQMNFYLNYWKDKMMGEGDHPPVGLILCTNKDQTKVEYATGGLDHQLFVSRYLVALPKPEQLQALVENDRVQWEEKHAAIESIGGTP